MSTFERNIAWLGLGVAGAYFLDPESGSRRRAVARDKLVRSANKGADWLDTAFRDASNRARGIAAEVRNRDPRALTEIPSEFLEENWPPSIRLLAGAAGAALLLYGWNRRDLPGAVVGFAGAALAARAATNEKLSRLTGIGAGRRAVDIQKTIHVAAPVGRVFELWSNFRNFPQFMSNVRDIRETGNGATHWTVSGPGGIPVEWDAVVTEMLPNSILAWKTAPGSVVQHSGIVRFQPDAEGGTRVSVRLSYNPVAGQIGHLVAALFGADPKTQMDQDLQRMKTFIETGKPPSDAAARREGKAGSSA